MYDVAIIGAGPAGVSAALNLKLHNKSILWLGSPKGSRKVELSEKIANYPGVPMVTGAALNEAMLAQARDLDLELTDKMVTKISANRKGFMLLGDDEIFEARCVILTTGSVTAKGFAGEDALLGRGVSYCATCDGFLYRGKTIAVYCGDKRYEHEAVYLAGIAEKVYLFTPYKDVDIDLPNVERVDKPVKSIEGEKRVNALTLFDGSVLPVDGFFILRTAIAPATLLYGLELDGPHIVINRRCETNQPGVFAAGDCTGRPYQIAKAVGEGNVAAHSALDYLADLEKK